MRNLWDGIVNMAWGLVPWPIRMCDSCRACSGTKCDERMHYKNFGPGKAWDHTLINHSMYLSMPGELSPWSTVPGWTLESTAFDFMHNLYLGTGRDLVGSTFKCLIWRGAYSHVPMTDMNSILAFMQEEMVHECRQCGPHGQILKPINFLIPPPSFFVFEKPNWLQFLFLGVCNYLCLICIPLKPPIRLYLPRKPNLTEASLSDKDYSEISTKFKACHVKIMVYWIAKKTKEAAESQPQDPGMDFVCQPFHMYACATKCQWGSSIFISNIWYIQQLPPNISGFISCLVKATIVLVWGEFEKKTEWSFPNPACARTSFYKFWRLAASPCRNASPYWTMRGWF